MIPRGELTAKVLAARRKEPNRLMVSIAKENGVSRERVRQILTRAYEETQAPCYHPRLPLRPVCQRCGQGLTYWEVYRSKGKTAQCLVCDREARQVLLTCSLCGEPFLRAAYLVRAAAKQGYKFAFCTKRCLGTYAGEHYGYIAHPENSYAGSRARRGKHWWTPLLPELCQRRLQGESLASALEALNIPHNNYSQILHALEAQP